MEKSDKAKKKNVFERKTPKKTIEANGIAKLFDANANMIGEVSIEHGLWDDKDNPKLIAQAIKTYLSNQRCAYAKTKDRGDVNGSTRKIWRQKGTGRARHGDIRAPIFVGGGVAHSPTGEGNWKKKMSKKMRSKAMMVALGERLREGRIIVVQGLEEIKPKTKLANQFIQNLKTNSEVAKKARQLVLITNKGNSMLKRAFSNLRSKGINICLIDSLNPYIVLENDLLIFDSRVIKF